MKRSVIALAMLTGIGLTGESSADIALWDDCISIHDGAAPGDGIADFLYNPISGAMTLDTDGATVFAMVIDGPSAASTIDSFQYGSIHLGDILVPLERTWIQEYFVGTEQWADLSCMGIDGVFQIATYAPGLAATDFGWIEYGTRDGQIVFLNEPEPEPDPVAPVITPDPIDVPETPTEPIERVPTPDPISPPDVPADPIIPVVTPDPVDVPETPPESVEPVPTPDPVRPPEVPVESIDPAVIADPIDDPGLDQPAVIIKPAVEPWRSPDGRILVDADSLVRLTLDELEYNGFTLSPGSPFRKVGYQGNGIFASDAVDGSVPEPSTLVGLITALLSIGGWWWRRTAA